MERGGDRSAGLGGTATVVPKQSKHVELAKEFLAFAKGSEEGNKNSGAYSALTRFAGMYGAPRN